MNIYGGGGVEMARAGGIRVGASTSGQTNAAKRLSRSSALPASTPYGSQPAANPPPNLPNPAGCLLSARYAAEQSAPDPAYFTTHSYAELAGGF